MYPIDFVWPPLSVCLPHWNSSTHCSVTWLPRSSLLSERKLVGMFWLQVIVDRVVQIPTIIQNGEWIPATCEGSPAHPYDTCGGVLQLRCKTGSSWLLDGSDEEAGVTLSPPTICVLSSAWPKTMVLCHTILCDFHHDNNSSVQLKCSQFVSREPPFHYVGKSSQLKNH